MRLLDRYLLREFIVPFVYCLSFFLVFWITFDLITQLDRFQRHGLSAGAVVKYYLVKTPNDLSVVVPVALLLALLYTLANHARYNELTAMRTAGVSLWRLSLPYFAVSVIIAAAMFFIHEVWLPNKAGAAESMLAQRNPARSGADPNWEQGLGFDNTARNRTWFIEAYNVQTYEMLRPRIWWTLVTGTRREISAERAYWRDGAWVFTNVQELVYPPVKGALPGPPIETNLLVLTELSETPEKIASEIRIRRIDSNNLREVRKAQFSIREILDYQARHPERTNKLRVLEIKLHGRIAAPWTSVVVVLIALPFGAVTGRRNVFVGVAMSIVICFSYFVMVPIGLAMGIRGWVPPWLAAWGPNLIFGLTGFILTWRLR